MPVFIVNRLLSTYSLIIVNQYCAMVRIYTSFVFVVIMIGTGHLFAQSSLPTVGAVSRDDLLLKECPFEKNAPAMILLDAVEISFWEESRSIKVITERKVRIKIFSEKGLKYANIKIPHLNRKNGTKIKDISASSYNLDSAGKIITEKINKDQIFRGKINEDFRDLSFTFPGIKNGSIIEYSFTKVETNYFLISPWIIQDKIPVQLATFKITAPPGIEIDYRVRSKTLITQIDTAVDLRFGRGYERYQSFFSKNISSFKEEPYMSSLDDNIDRIEFSMGTKRFFNINVGTNLKWELLNKFMYSSSFYGEQLTKTINGTDFIIDSVKKLESMDQKIKYLYQYLREYLKWDGTRSVYADDLQDCWNAKTGNSTELNMILLNLLKKAGISCKGILIRPREDGMLDKNFVSLGQFNTVDVWIPDSNNVYILDLTQKYTSHRIPPYNIVFRNAFALDSLGGNWIYISDNRPLSKKLISVKAQFDSTEKISGQAAFFYYDFAKMDKLKSKEKEKLKGEKKEEKEKSVDKLISLNTFDKKEENAEDIMNPFIEKFSFTYAPTSTNQYYYFKPLLLYSLEDNPFLADVRQTDIDMGCNQQFFFQMSISIPAGMTYDYFPENISLRNSDSSIVFKRQSILEGKQAFVKISIDYNKPYFKKEEYPIVKEFFKKLYILLNEQIVLKKIN